MAEGKNDFRYDCPGTEIMNTVSNSSSTSPAERIAPLWHTLVLVVVILVFSLAGSGRQHLVTSSRARQMQYTFTLIWEWALVAYCVWGVRKSGRGLRDLIGGRWHEIEDVLIDVLIAAGFWVAAMITLSAIARSLHLTGGNQLDDVRRQLGFIVPRSAREVALWMMLSLTAGFCEEVIFRGYLQGQFTALFRNVWAGILASGLLFGAAHGYEGGRRMLLVGLYGMMFGVLAHFRRSLRPGMIAHAFHDGVMGLALKFFLK